MMANCASASVFVFAIASLRHPLSAGNFLKFYFNAKFHGMSIF